MGVSGVSGLSVLPFAPYMGDAYYIDATLGNDGNSGRTPGDAWQTIGQVNGFAFLPGDRILFKRGETWVGVALTIPTSGIAGAPIIFGTYDFGVDPIIDGNDVAECVQAIGRSHIRFGGLECIQGINSGFQFNTCHHVEVAECDARDCGNDNLIFITGCYDCTVYGGSFYDAYQRVGGSTVSGIEIADGCYDIIIDDVVCYGQIDGGMGLTIHSHIATVMPYDITVRNSTFRNNAGNGLQVLKQDNAADASRNINIYGCVFHTNTLDGVRTYKSVGAANYPDGITVRDCYSYGNTRYAYWWEGDDLVVRQNRFRGRGFINATINIDFIYNTLYFETGLGLYPLYIQNARCSGIVVQNNITNSTVAGGMMIGVAAGVIGANVDIDYNLYQLDVENVLNTRWHWLGVNENWANWLANSGQDANSPMADQDPLFVAPPNDLHLQAASPARGIGIDLGYGLDLGAYQYEA